MKRLSLVVASALIGVVVACAAPTGHAGSGYTPARDGVDARVMDGRRPGQAQPTAPALDPALLDGVDELWVVSRSEPTGAPEPARPGTGELRAQVDGREIPLPLEHADVSARIAAYVATVDVTQRYANSYTTEVEAVYVFPLPQNAAVSDFLMIIGERRIRGIIKRRAEAERLYAEARSQGYVASLLTQERPSVFTQRVANLEPGRSIEVSLTYHQVLPYRGDGYALVFPMVAGPRLPGEASASRVSLSVDLEAGLEVKDIESPSHGVQIERLSPTRRRVRLTDTAADRDFVLRWTVAGDSLEAGFLTHRDGTGGYFTLVLQPPRDLEGIGRAPVELIFVLDCSSSMRGVPLQKAQRAVTRALSRLDPRDTFQIIRFSSDASRLGSAPVPATRRNVARGLRYLEALEGEGGTPMTEGLRAALDFPHDEERVRLVTLMTDGHIGNERQVLEAIHQRLGASRIFSFGVGSDPNRFLLERMARMGQGAVAYVGLDDDASDRAVDAFYERIARPVLSDVSLEFRGLQVGEVFPARLPDLFVGRPLVVTGRFEGEPEGTVTLRGRIEGREVSRTLAVKGDDESRPALARTWARMKISELAHAALFADGGWDAAERIEEVALTYGLLSRYTAFVAVDTTLRPWRRDRP